MKKPNKKEKFFGLTEVILATAAKKETDHAKEEKDPIKQGDVTKCGYTVKEVLKDGRLALVTVDELKIVSRDSVNF